MRGLLVGLVMCAVPLLSVVAQPSAISGRATGLSSPTRVIDLSDPRLTSGATIGDALEATQGISFGGALLLNGGDSFNLFAVPAVWNGVSSDISPLITMTFSRPVLGVAFNVLAQRFGTSMRFETVSEAGRIDFFTGRPQDPTEFPSGAPFPSLTWWGFEGALISSVSVFAPVTQPAGSEELVWALGLANITVQDQPLQAIVPEPGALGLLVMGASALLLGRRRRQR